MKLLILSDLHVEFEEFRLPKDLDYDVAILAGDIHSPGRLVAPWARATEFLQKPVIHVAGNHEYYDCQLENEQEAMRAASAEHGVHFLDCDEVVIDGVRFLGCTMWTDFALRIDVRGLPGKPARRISNRDRGMSEVGRALNDFRLIWRSVVDGQESGDNRRLKPIDTLQIYRAHRSWLRRKLAEPFVGRTVVVTHHAPHRGSLAPRYADDWVSTGFVTEMQDEFFEVPALWAHGHTHDSFDYSVGNCRVVCNPRGYVRWTGAAENKSFDAAMVVCI
ncbi:metallophosphoesterase [Variovorax rhizosphaerae]|uniref:Metallophosphoesterase n=1 Tax=Variovorax rhizosphaerae TaxID=1836200 RepID=A0ABU8WVF4_9BURK